MTRNTINLFYLLALLLVSGCATGTGPRAVSQERFNYNQHIVGSQNEQMLLNLVRLRYNDTPLFLDLTSVTAQYTVEANASAMATIGFEGTSDNETGLGGSVNYAEQPTISYIPLQGEEFARRVLSPITPETVLLLSEGGWSIERLLLLCVQRMNGINNATAASGPTPTHAPVFEDFQELAGLFRQLQKANAITVNVEGEAADRRVNIALSPPEKLNEAQREVSRRFRSKLGLPADRTVFNLTGAGKPTNPGEIAMTGRSLLGVLFFLSQGVEPPEPDREKGFVTITRTANGEEFDWAKVTGKVMRIQSKESRPGNAFVKVRYRGSWYYIDDADLDSKATFGLLNYLFSLQSAGSEGQTPLLTLPVGG